MASSSSSSLCSSSLFDIEPLECGETCRRCAMDACSLCGKPLSRDCDIFMYRGDAPFCSEECRHNQIEMDEAITERIHTRPVKERAAMNGQHLLHETSASESGNATVAANVAVAI